MSANRLKRARFEFERKIQEAHAFALRCQTARHPSVNRQALKTSEIEWVLETAVLKMVVASD